MNLVCFASNVATTFFHGSVSSKIETPGSDDYFYYPSSTYSNIPVSGSFEIPDGYEIEGIYTFPRSTDGTYYALNWAHGCTTKLSLSGTGPFSFTTSNLKYWLSQTSLSNYFYGGLVKFKPKTYTVTFNANGGSTPSPASKSVRYLGTYGELATCTRDGYELEGWYTAATGGTKVEPTTVYELTTSSTLYAHWTEKRIFTVTLDPNEGSGGTSSVKAELENPMPQITVPSREGYLFTGYFTSAEGGDKYYNADGTSARNWDIRADTTLLAQWEGVGLVVSYDPNGGVCPRYFDVVQAGGTFPTLPIATKDGEQVSVWYTQPTGGVAVHSGDAVTQTVDFILYAHWGETTSYTVTFNGNGGNPDAASKNVFNGQQYGPLPGCYQTGKTFLGWYTALSGGTKVDPTTVVQLTANQTLYAHWSNVSPAVKWYYLVEDE